MATRSAWLLMFLLLVVGGLPAIADDDIPSTDSVEGWLSWRGPDQNGASHETGLIETIELDGKNHAWTYPVSGRGAPVIAGHRLYALGYRGEKAELQELLFCLDARTGELIWEHRFSDFINDAIFNRYAIGSPTIDGTTGNVFSLTSAGLLNCFTWDGHLVWQRSLMEVNGRMTFPNGRIGAPVIDGDRVIVQAISSSWGAEGPARNRFFAFSKFTGEQIWSSTPGVEPKDSSFSTPVLEWRNGRRVMYAGTGCGHVVAIDARTGEPLWRFRMTIGGVNCSPVLYGDKLISIHGKENLDTSEHGRMVCLPLGAEPAKGQEGPVELGMDAEIWRNHLMIFTSSPVLAGNRVYQTVHTGELCSVDADTGKILWEEKLAPEQIHASPLWADGKLYVPMNDGKFFIVRPKDSGPERLAEVQLAGDCLGAPSVWDGRIFVHTTEALYCFTDTSRPAPAETAPVTRLQIVPSEVTARPGQRIGFTVRGLDALGNIVKANLPGASIELPGNLKISVSDEQELVVAPDSAYGAGVGKVSADGATGTVRFRIVPGDHYTQNFNAIPLTVKHYEEEGVMMNFPPSHWFSSRPKWEVRELEGEKVLAKRLDNTLFQRSMVMISDPDISDYTAQIDIMSDGNRRAMSSAGLVHQRYLIELKGNARELEITSNDERIKEAVKYVWKPKVWYRLKSKVENQPDGSTWVRAKVWPRDEDEPEAWTIEYHHKNGHRHGSFGIIGYTPQSRNRVYVDNLMVTPND
ncbi:MAG: PQQ-binding-like beta-propeller repeat protein [Planctomycetota bacterium]